MNRVTRAFKALFGAPSPAATAPVATNPPSAPVLADADTWLARGNQALAAGQVGEAERCYRQALLAAPDHPLPALNLGFVLLEQGHAPTAATLLAQALERAPADAPYLHDIHFTLGCAQRAQGRVDDGIAHLQQAVALQPQFLQGLAELTASLLLAGRHAEAVETARQWIALQPSVPAFLLGAQALHALGRTGETVEWLDRVLQIDPRHRDAHYNKVHALVELLRVDEAVQAGRVACELHPQDADLRWNTGVAHLLAGDLVPGWTGLEARWQAASLGRKDPIPSAGRPAWDGRESLAGRTILLYCEQGLGDTLHFLRYVPQVAADAGQVIVQVQPVLAQLAARGMPANVTVVPRGQALPAFDLHCALMSLPFAVGTSLADIPAPIPYLHADPAQVQRWRERLEREAPGVPRIGIVWSGSAQHGNDQNRSLPLAAFATLQAAGVRFVSLQPEVRASDAQALAGWPGLLQYGQELRTFDDTAGLVQALDLVVSVDTSVAHLVGALGRPLWLLLPYCPDWRWLLEREDSPWYPSARLYRQPGPREWDPVLARLRQDLRARFS